jgi:hypothetical protein
MHAIADGIEPAQRMEVEARHVHLRWARHDIAEGNGWAETWPETWPLLIFLLVVTTIAVARFRRTLD